MFLFNKKGLNNQLSDLSLFKAIVDDLSNAVIILNINGVILYANGAALKLIELKSNQLLNQKQNLIRIIDSKNGHDLNYLIEKFIRSGKIVRCLNKNSIIFKSNGKTIPVAISLNPLKDKNNKIWGGFMVLDDITKYKEVEQTKTEFVSLTSHQFKTPLSTIKWYSEAILAGAVGRLSNEQNKYIKEIHNSTQRMIDLVNDLLNISRIDLGTIAIKPEKVNFKEVAESVLAEIIPQIRNKKIKIIRKYDKIIPDIIIDAKLARIICQNLLSNAIKYTPLSGQVAISINKLKDKLLITVADTGIGIPQDQQDQIFSRLFRARNAKKQLTEGTGLGLFIVKLAVEKLGGSIWFESVEGKGTKFYVSIPLKGIKRRQKRKSK